MSRVQTALTVWPVLSFAPASRCSTSGPDGMPEVAIDALRRSFDQLRVCGLSASKILTVDGTIESLKLKVSFEPGIISSPLVTGVPSGRVTDATRGTIVVVKVQWPPFTWCLVVSWKGLRVTV